MGIPSEEFTIPSNGEFTRSAGSASNPEMVETKMPGIDNTIKVPDSYASEAPLGGFKSTVQPSGGMESYKTQGV